VVPPDAAFEDVYIAKHTVWEEADGSGASGKDSQAFQERHTWTIQASTISKEPRSKEFN
jgi:hypothetical protein